MLELPSVPINKINILVDKEERKLYEEEMENSVGRVITNARGSVSSDMSTEETRSKVLSIRQSSKMLLVALESNLDDDGSFGGWNPWIKQLIGAKYCHDIGIEVCEEENFTQEEAIYIITRNPHPLSPF